VGVAFPETRAIGSTYLPCDIQYYNAPKVRFPTTLGDKPEMEFTCVIVPIRTENRLRFSALLHDGAPEVRFERAVHG
jgi:hypothetical protein